MADASADQEEEQKPSYVQLPHNWQLMEPGKMIDALLTAYGNAKDEVMGLLKIESNKLKRLISSSRVHNERMTKKKLDNLLKAKQVLMRGN